MVFRDPKSTFRKQLGTKQPERPQGAPILDSRVLKVPLIYYAENRTTTPVETQIRPQILLEKRRLVMHEAHLQTALAYRGNDANAGLSLAVFLGDAFLRYPRLKNCDLFRTSS